MSLSELFDGNQHWFVPDQDFQVEPNSVRIEVEDEDDLLSFESGTPVLFEYNGDPIYPAGPLPYQAEASAWAAVSMALKALAFCIGGQSETYQHSHYDEMGKPLEPAFSFLFKPGSDGYQGGRI